MISGNKQASALHGDRARSSGWDMAHQRFWDADQERMAWLEREIKAVRRSCPGCGRAVSGDECISCGSVKNVRNRVWMRKKRKERRP